MENFPQVILLNGASSAGKTSIAKELQELLLPDLYLNYSIDSILYALPPSVLKRMTTGQDLSDLNYRALVESYYASAQALVAKGNRLIMDDAVTDADIAALLMSSLRNSGLFIVGVHCSLDELNRRERERGDRTLGEAAGQFLKVHQFLKYDLEVDTTGPAPKSLAQKILQSLGGPTPPAREAAA